MDLKRFKIFVASLMLLSTNSFLPVKINAYYIKICRNCQEKLCIRDQPKMLFDHPMIPCYLLKHPLTHLLPIGERERVRGAKDNWRKS
jgi:hypothetical protein